MGGSKVCSLLVDGRQTDPVVVALVADAGTLCAAAEGAHQAAGATLENVLPAGTQAEVRTVQASRLQSWPV